VQVKGITLITIPSSPDSILLPDMEDTLAAGHSTVDE